jgi:uroporphyrinogen III methyltransferase/synthase
MLRSTPHGRVYLVGAGPGDPGLITWRGVQCLARADVVLYDYLANSALLAHAPPGAELICLGRHGSERIWSQHEVNERMVALARGGKSVVRLKGGDPAVFARLADEIAVLEAANIDYEIVPGITAALAAASYAAVPLTDRDRASAMALVTGHENDDKSAPALDFAALAAFPGTLVIYMGVTTARHWTDALIAAGKPAATPAAIVRRCTWPDQEVLRCTLGTVAQEIAARAIRPPVITVIGEVAAHAGAANWFNQRLLSGRRILITRPPHQAGKLFSLLGECGADCLFQPAIDIRSPADWSAVDMVLARLADFDWVVFSSANGVEHFFGRLLATGRDLRALGSVKIAAIGSGTAEALAGLHLRSDLTPESFRAESLAESLVAAVGPEADILARDDPAAPWPRIPRLLLVRASRGREVLAETLVQAGCAVEQVVVYESIDTPSADPEIAAKLQSGRIDWITVTSSAIARSLVRLFGDDLGRAKLASISPITSATLRELGHAPAAEARHYTMEGVVAAICDAERSGELR